jgi:leucyl aminopeptidase (aminopeptidase T)
MIMDGVVEILDQGQKIRDLTPEEKEAGENVMRQCMEVKSGEQVLVVTDSGKKDVEAAIFFEAAKKFTNNVVLVDMVPGTENAQEPPEKVAEMMRKSDVALLVTSYSLSHTQARLKACEAGTRIASMPKITRELILRTLTIDYGEVAELSKKLAKVLSKGKKVKLTSNKGTNLKLDLSGREAIDDTGIYTKKGDCGNLPAGEAFIAPLEGKAEGIVIFDGVFSDIEIDVPVEVVLKKGWVKNIEGGEAARLLNGRLAKVGKEAYQIGELGIGTNKVAKLGGSLLEVEKVYGTVHLALGKNDTFGGEVDVPFHSDGVILKPTLEVDGKTILKGGKFEE